MPVQPTQVPARRASGHSPALSDARLLSALATLRDALAPGQALNVPTALDRAALLACLSVLTTDTAVPAPVSAPATPHLAKPPRLNFAGYCEICADHGCHKPRCITIWAGLAFAVCPDCHGSGGVGGVTCNCLMGVREVNTSTPGAVI